MATRVSGRRIYGTADVARAAGCTVQSVHLAEAEGRIPQVRRDELGHRVYAAADLERIKTLMRR